MASFRSEDLDKEIIGANDTTSNQSVLSPRNSNKSLSIKSISKSVPPIIRMHSPEDTEIPKFKVQSPKVESQKKRNTLVICQGSIGKRLLFFQLFDQNRIIFWKFKNSMSHYCLRS